MDHSSSRRRRVMDAEGGRAVHRAKRARMLKVVAALQYLLVIACLLVTFYVYWNSNQDAQMLPAFEDDVHIGFVAALLNHTPHSPEEPDKQYNITLKFVDTLSSNRMAVHDDVKISVNCTGPYVLYMDACCKSVRKNNSRGTLELLVARSETPLSSLTLNASALACRGLHSIVYLRKNDEVSVQLKHPFYFKLLNVTGGLHYMLGSHCEY